MLTLLSVHQAQLSKCLKLYLSLKTYMLYICLHYLAKLKGRSKKEKWKMLINRSRTGNKNLLGRRTSKQQNQQVFPKVGTLHWFQDGISRISRIQFPDWVCSVPLPPKSCASGICQHSSAPTTCQLPPTAFLICLQDPHVASCFEPSPVFSAVM